MGVAREQARLEVNQALQLPHSGAAAGDVRLTMFEQLTSQEVALGGSQRELTCELPCRPQGGVESSVKLRIRRVSPGPAAKEAECRATLKEHLELEDIHDLLQSLIQDTLATHPVDPYRHVLNRLRSLRATRAAQHGGVPVTEAARNRPVPPLVAKPPDAPPALGHRPFRRSRGPGAAADVLRDATLGPRPDEARALPGDEGAMRERRSDARMAARASIDLLLCTSVGRPSPPLPGDQAEPVGESPPSVVTPQQEDISRQHRMEARIGARHSVAMLLSRSASLAEAPGAARSDSEVREQGQQAASPALGSGPRAEASTVLRTVYKQASVTTSPEYRRSMARWALQSLFRSASQSMEQQQQHAGSLC